MAGRGTYSRMAMADSALAHRVAAEGHRQRAVLEARMAELHDAAAEVQQLRADGHRHRAQHLRVQTMGQYAEMMALRRDIMTRYSSAEISDKFEVSVNYLTTQLQRLLSPEFVHRSRYWKDPSPALATKEGTDEHET